MENKDDGEEKKMGSRKKSADLKVIKDEKARN